MTVSSGNMPSSNLQALLAPTSAGQGFDGQMAMSSLSGDDLSSSLPSSAKTEGRFAALLDQQLTQQELKKLLQNSSLDQMPMPLEVLPSQIQLQLKSGQVDMQELAADWLQILKSHFVASDSELAITDSAELKEASNVDISGLEVSLESSETDAQTLEMLLPETPDPLAPLAQPAQAAPEVMPNPEASDLADSAAVPPIPSDDLAAQTIAGGEALPLSRQSDAMPSVTAEAEDESALDALNPLGSRRDSSAEITTAAALNSEVQSKAAGAGSNPNPGALANWTAGAKEEGKVEPLASASDDEPLDLDAKPKDETGQLLTDRATRQTLAEASQPAANRGADMSSASGNAGNSASSVASLNLAPHLQTPANSQPQPLPADLQTLQIPQSANAHQWGLAVGERVAMMINHKLNSAEIRLDPPHLGKLDIQIQIKDDTAVVHINTQHAQTRDLIDNAGQRLREFLQEAGYSSVDVNVSHQESSAQQQADADQGGSHSSQAQRDELKDDSMTRLEAHLPRGYQASEGVIDYFA